MSTDGTFKYQLLILDQEKTTDITCEKSLLLGLSYPEKLWEDVTLHEHDLQDSAQKITLRTEEIHSSSKKENETSFIINIEGEDLEKLDLFRGRLLHHLKNKLGFTNISVLTDEVAASIANAISPLITKVENNLRHHIAKTHATNLGIHWWEEKAPEAIKKKVAARVEANTSFAGLIDANIMFTDFYDLSVLAKELFTDKGFAEKWEKLAELKAKVDYHHLFAQEDLDTAQALTDDLLKLTGSVTPAPSSKPKTKSKPKSNVKANETPKANNTEKRKEEKAEAKPAQPVEKPKEEAKTPEPSTNTPEPAAATTDKSEAPVSEPVAKAPEKAEAPEPKKEPVTPPRNTGTGSDFINEADFIAALKQVESQTKDYVDLKKFVKENLVPKGYMAGPTFSLAQSLNTKGVVTIYDIKDEQGMPQKAVKTI